MKKLLLGVVLMLSGCMSEITEPEISRAQEVCAGRGGLYAIRGSMKNIYCRDLTSHELYK